MTESDVLVRLLSRARLSHDAERCLGARHRRSTCRLCIDGCPVGAVRLEAGVRVDHSRCVGCGACVNLCPTGAFDLIHPTYQGLLAQASAAKTLRITCTQVAQNGKSVSVPCLAYLNEAVYVGAVAGGAQGIAINVGPCASCPLGDTLPTTMRAAHRANRMASLLGRTAIVSVRSEETTQESVAGSPGQCSRRQFFQLAGSGFRGMLAERNGKPGRRQADNGMVTLQPSLSWKHSALLEALVTMGPPTPGQARACDLPFSDIEIGADCDGCGMCAAFCPTGALARHDETARRWIGFRVSHCSGCRLCQDICPRECIALVDSVDPSELAAGSSKTLKEFDKVACRKCGRTYLNSGSERLCPDCRRGSLVKRQVTEV